MQRAGEGAGDGWGDGRRAKDDMVEERRRGGRSRQWMAQLGVDVKEPAADLAGMTEWEVEAAVGPAPGRDWDGGRIASERRRWGRWSAASRGRRQQWIWRRRRQGKRLGLDWEILGDFTGRILYL